MKKEEDAIRMIFSSDKANKETGNNLLIDVYANVSKFILEDVSIPLILTANRVQNTIANKVEMCDSQSEKKPSVVPFLEFSKNWSLLTKDVFEGLNWSNVLVAGGSVLSCILPSINKFCSCFFSHLRLCQTVWKRPCSWLQWIPFN